MKPVHIALIAGGGIVLLLMLRRTAQPSGGAAGDGGLTGLFGLGDATALATTNPYVAGAAAVAPHAEGIIRAQGEAFPPIIGAVGGLVTTVARVPGQVIGGIVRGLKFW